MSDKAILPGVEIDSLGLNEEGKRWSIIAAESAVINGSMSDTSGSSVTIQQLQSLTDSIITSGSSNEFLAADGAYHEISATTSASLDWGNIADKPLSFPPESHTHGTDDLSGLGTAALADSTDFDTAGSAAAVQENLDSLTPLAINAAEREHTHDIYITIEEVDGIISNLDLGITTVSWGNIADKPLSFPPESHTHGTNDLSGLGTAALANSTDFDTAGSAAAVQENLDSLTPLAIDAADREHDHDARYDTAGSSAAVQANLDTHTAGSNPHGVTAIGLGALEMVEVTALPSTSGAASNVIYARNALGDWLSEGDGFYKLIGSVFVEMGGA